MYCKCRELPKVEDNILFLFLFSVKTLLAPPWIRDLHLLLGEHQDEYWCATFCSFTFLETFPVRIPLPLAYLHPFSSLPLQNIMWTFNSKILFQMAASMGIVQKLSMSQPVNLRPSYGLGVSGAWQPLSGWGRKEAGVSTGTWWMLLVLWKLLEWEAISHQCFWLQSGQS